MRDLVSISSPEASPLLLVFAAPMFTAALVWRTLSRLVTTAVPSPPCSPTLTPGPGHGSSPQLERLHRRLHRIAWCPGGNARRVPARSCHSPTPRLSESGLRPLASPLVKPLVGGDPCRRRDGGLQSHLDHGRHRATTVGLPHGGAPGVQPVPLEAAADEHREVRNSAALTIRNVASGEADATSVVFEALGHRDWPTGV